MYFNDPMNCYTGRSYGKRLDHKANTYQAYITQVSIDDRIIAESRRGNF
jgi:hypothetical protein